MTALITHNFPEAIRSRLAEGRVPRFGSLLLLIARPALALLAQRIILLLFAQWNVPNASTTIRNWWTVYGTLFDFGCLRLLFWLIRRENIRLLDLFSFSKKFLKVDYH